MTSRQADVVIIGAGSTGLSAAYELAKAGVDVLVVERSFLAAEGSGRNLGGIRQIGRDINEVPLMVAAMQRWHQLEEELDYNIELTEDGYLWVALSEEELSLQRELAKRDASYGIKEFVLCGNEIKDLSPAISDTALGALYSPTDCIADPFRVAKGYFDAAQRYGARFLFDAEVTNLRLQTGQIQGVITNRGEIATDTLIVAAGPWSDQIGRMAGIEIPITPCPNQIIVTEPVPLILPPFLLISSIAVCRQSSRRHVYIGNTNAPGGITGYSKKTDYGELVRTVRNIIKIVPALRNLNVMRTWAGTLDFTPDDNFVLSRVEEVEGLILACGFAGHGFALAPIIGSLLRELIVDGKTSLPVAAFQFDRFKYGAVGKTKHFAHHH